MVMYVMMVQPSPAMATQMYIVFQVFSTPSCSVNEVTLLLGHGIPSEWGFDKIWTGSDRIGLTKPRPDRTGLTKPHIGAVR